MKKRHAITSIAAVAATAAAIAAVPSAGAATVREFEGTVTSVDRSERTFRLRDEGRSVTIRVTGSTRYERLSGFGAIRAGRRDIETVAKRSSGRWVATLVERSGRGADRSGSGSRSGDGDDAPGDDDER